MKNNFFSLPVASFILSFFAAFLTLSSPLSAKDKRTDGPAGSEFGDFKNWDGQLQIGARFGASFLTNGDKTSFLLGADADYRPADIFGFRLNFEQSLQSPRLSLIHFTPLIHTEYSNFKPYLFFGPGVTVVSGDDTAAKFSLATGVGGDFMLTEKIGFGMLWTYYMIFDSVDATSLAARFSFWF